MPPLADRPQTYMGLDIARKHHLWILVVLEKQGDVLYTREIITRKNIKFSEQEHILETYIRKYNPIRVTIDETGMGMPVVEAAKLKHGNTRIEGVMFNIASKHEMAILIKQKFEDKRIRISQGDGALRADLHSISKKTTVASTHPVFNDDGTSDGHANRFWAMALAISAAETAPFITSGYRGIRGINAQILNHF